MAATTRFRFVPVRSWIISKESNPLLSQQRDGWCFILQRTNHLILKPASKQVCPATRTLHPSSFRQPLSLSKQAPSLHSHIQHHELHLAIHLLPIPLFQDPTSSSAKPLASSATVNKETRTVSKAYTRSTRTRRQWQTQQCWPQRCHLTIFAPVRCSSGILLLPQWKEQQTTQYVDGPWLHRRGYRLLYATGCQG